MYLAKFIQKRGRKAIAMRLTLPNKKEWWLPTKISVEPNQWDGKKQRVKRSHPHHQLLNIKLEKLMLEVSQIINRAQIEGLDIATELDAALKDKQGGKLSQTPAQLLAKLIDTIAAENTKTKATIYNYKSFLLAFLAFEEVNGALVSWKQINPAFRQAFEVYLTTPQPEGAGMAESTANKTLRNFRTLLNELAERQWIAEPPHIGKFGVKPVPADAVALSEAELKLLQSVDVQNETEQWVRDMFVFMAKTGLRISDAESITHRDVFTFAQTTPNGSQLATLFNAKTKKHVPVFLSPHALAILDRWEYNLARYHRNNINTLIKKLAERAGLTNLQTITKTTNGNIQHETIPLYQLVACHTARRTYATILDRKGANKDAIQATMGHTSKALTNRYIKNDEAQKLASLAGLID
jgi:integrase